MGVRLPGVLPRGPGFSKKSVIQAGPFVTVRTHVKSQSQSSAARHHVPLSQKKKNSTTANLPTKQKEQQIAKQNRIKIKILHFGRCIKHFGRCLYLLSQSPYVIKADR